MTHDARAAGFRDLYEAHAPAVHRFVSRLSGDNVLAEDITAETFLRVWSSDIPVRLSTARAYLYTIARRLFIEQARRAQRHTPLLNDFPHSTDTARDAEARDTLKHLDLALAQLPEDSRAALILHAVEELPYSEIAAVLDITVTAAKVKVHRARLRLQDSLQRSPQ